MNSSAGGQQISLGTTADAVVGHIRCPGGVAVFQASVGCPGRWAASQILRTRWCSRRTGGAPRWSRCATRSTKRWPQTSSMRSSGAHPPSTTRSGAPASGTPEADHVRGAACVCGTVARSECPQLTALRSLLTSAGECKAVRCIGRVCVPPFVMAGP